MTGELNIKELAAKSLLELHDEEQRLRRQLFDLRFRHRTRQLVDTSELSKVRKQIARVLTVAGVKAKQV